MATFELLADLPLEIEGYELQGLEHQTPGFERLSTTIHLWGAARTGLARTSPTTPSTTSPCRMPARRST